MADHTELIKKLEFIAECAASSSPMDCLDPSVLEGTMDEVIELLKNSDIRTRRSPQPAPVAGQQWRNRKSNHLVRITEVGHNPWGELTVYWRSMQFTGRANGHCMYRTFTSGYDCVETPILNEIIGRICVNGDMHEVRWPTDLDDPDRRGGYAYCEIEAGVEYEIEAPDGMDPEDVLAAMAEHIENQAQKKAHETSEEGSRG